MLQAILEKAVGLGASDVLLIAGLPVSFKVSGVITREPTERLTPAQCEAFAKEVYAMASNRDMTRLLETGDDDFSFSVPGLSRFRVNTLRQRGTLGVIIRVIAFELPDRVKLGIPDNVMAFSRLTKGLVLITGMAGSGKSTTLACIVNEINTTRSAHIITIEDPLEFLHRHQKSVVTQREIATDTASYKVALRAALREAPDIILLGEMRDPETIAAAVAAAETGYLVISTLHTLGAANTVDRIVSAFPSEQQRQIRSQLALILMGVASQQLLHTVDGKMAPAFEVMTASSAVRNLIRESKGYQLDNVIANSASEGMVTMDQSLLSLVREGKISAQEAVQHSVNPEWLSKRLTETV